VRYDNIDVLEQVLRPDSEFQITKTVKCGDQIVDPSVITFQNISPPTAAYAGSADIVLSGYEFGDTENTYSFEILASNDDLELIITGFITLGALPETVEIEREVAIMLVPGTTQFEGVEALVADAYEELGVENAGFNEANLAKVNDVTLAVLMDPENVVTNVPDYLTNLNFQVDANVDNSFVRLYNEQIANNILNPDGYVFERTIDTWFGVDFVYTITAKPELPKNYLIPYEVLMITDENDVLRDEGEAYARKLDMAGVDVTCCRINGTIHDFLVLNALYETSQTQYAIDLACSAMKLALDSLGRNLS
jgi:hypothetical protein